MNTKANQKKDQKPVAATTTQEKPAEVSMDQVLSETIAALESRANSKKKKRVVWLQKEVDALKTIVSNKKFSIIAIVEVCSQTPIFSGKSKGSIEAMATALRKGSKELPFIVK